MKKALGTLRELITTTRTTRGGFWDPPFGSKRLQKYDMCLLAFGLKLLARSATALLWPHVASRLHLMSIG